MKFTAFVLTAFIVLATCLAPRKHFKRKEAFVLAVLFAILGSVPLLFGISKALDYFRFGTHHYASYDDISFLYRPAHWRIPKSATDITIEQGHNGFEATYKIEKEALQVFVDRSWEVQGQDSIMKRDECGPYDGPVEGDHGNFTIQYDENIGVAHQKASIW